MADRINVTFYTNATLNYPGNSLAWHCTRWTYGGAGNVWRPSSFDRCGVQMSGSDETQSRLVGVRAGVREGPGKHALTTTVREKLEKVKTGEADQEISLTSV